MTMHISVTKSAEQIITFGWSELPSKNSSNLQGLFALNPKAFHHSTKQLMSFHLLPSLISLEKFQYRHLDTHLELWIGELRHCTIYGAIRTAKFNM